MHRKVRIGIDVGGTFTDAVAIDNQTFEIVAKLKLPTTHSHANGVAQGIVDTINRMLEQSGIAPEDVVFIAHGTTQATNALLEGDVARVGILGVSTGVDALNARGETNTGNISLSNGKYLHVSHAFLDSKDMSDSSIAQQIDALAGQGAEVIVASESYSVDDPTNELRIIRCAAQKGLYATGGHEISQLYGLRVRTRTAVVNASLIPKMMETANMTESAVNSAQIQSELMIMRCDGGVMGINEVKKRPILTMLSGLAAGVAGALMYEKVSDGIFLEVGGTSVDISVIKNGRVMLKNAEVGWHKTYLQSLDVRTLGLAGGSMVLVQERAIADIGPRSAHIANKAYECFASPQSVVNPVLRFIAPREGDPASYAVIDCDGGAGLALTLAGAANILGYIPEGDYACGNVQAARTAWQLLADYLGKSVEECCRIVMDMAVDKAMKVIGPLIAEYELDPGFVTLVGGGGSASVLAPAIAGRENFKYVIARNAPYISTIGVALAMVREQIERTVANPTKEDIQRIRMEAIDQIVRSGANEQTVEVTIEIDAQKNILRAIATGSTELRTKDRIDAVATPEQMLETAAGALNSDACATKLCAQCGRWHVYTSTVTEKKLFGLFNRSRTSLAVLDREGIVRHKGGNEHFLKIRKRDLRTSFVEFIEQHTIYSDANAIIPKVFLFFNEKMLDLCAMQSMEQLMSMVDIELGLLDDAQELIAVAFR